MYMTDEELISRAESVIKPYKSKDGRLHADVGAAVLDKKGNLYTGVCIDTPSWGICAERSAIAAMITSGTYEIDKVVAVWRDNNTNELYILPPCGVCREFMKAIDEKNLDTKILLGKNSVKKLNELLPHNKWPDPI